jgi:hypothetical protein
VPAAAPSKPAAAPGFAAASKPAAAAPVPPATEAAAEADAEKHRAEISRKLSRTPGISRGVWISRSTLAVDRIVPEQEAWPLVCNQLKAYRDLEFTRVQMNPPQGSTDQVRWRQCGAL